jgi:hypothetical protein
MHIKNKIIQNLFSFFFFEGNVLSTHTNTHTHTHTHTHTNYNTQITQKYTRHQKLIRGATYKTSNLKDRLIVVFVFRQKQIKNTFSFVFKRHSQIKSKDFRFLQFSLTEQILDELFCKFHFCLIFTPSVTRNRETKQKQHTLSSTHETHH